MFLVVACTENEFLNVSKVDLCSIRFGLFVPVNFQFLVHKDG